MQKKRIVVISASTGGPTILSDIISALPEKITVPILIIQHMPEKFTQLLAKRLNEKSRILVKEARVGEKIKVSNVYLAKAGKHMRVYEKEGEHYILYSDEPPREGVKPCANYTYESLASTGYDKIYCVVLSGMGSDGTEGISYLNSKKNIEVWIQERKSCVVYGMPGSITKTNLEYQTLSIEEIVEKIKNL